MHLSWLFLHLLPLLLSLVFMFVGTIRLSLLFQPLLISSHRHLVMLSHLSCFPHPPRRLQILLLHLPWTLIYSLPSIRISALALIILSLTLFHLIICLLLFKHLLCHCHLLLFPSSMEEEIHTLDLNHTWDLIPKPAWTFIVGCHWVFIVKQNPNGTVDHLKARLVAKGFTQTYDIDYTQTFSPAAKLNFIHIIISLAANFDWPFH